jgi:hypothetical protein
VDAVYSVGQSLTSRGAFGRTQSAEGQNYSRTKGSRAASHARLGHLERPAHLCGANCLWRTGKVVRSCSQRKLH